jgi:beta-lactamase class A
MRLITLVLALALTFQAVSAQAAAAPKGAAAPKALPPVTKPVVEWTTPQAPIDHVADQLIPLLKGNTKPEDYFSPEFLAAVPAAQVTAITQKLIADYGQPIEVTAVEKKDKRSAVLTVAYEKAVATFQIATGDGANMYRVDGLLATDFALKGDSIESVTQAFSVLPGNSAFLIQSFNPGSAKLGFNTDNNLAIGSIFKLYILAELASEIEAGERKWTDMVPLTDQSFSSPKTTKLTKGSMVSLQDLATWMISVSDNGAADTLLRLMGRNKVEQKLAMVGHSNPEKILPFLTTVEAFALKSPANASLRKRFLAASEKQQRKFLSAQAKNLDYAKIDAKTFAAGPAHIDTIEWFASPYDVGRILNNLRLSGNKTALDILAINPGASDVSAAKWGYLGYKGGSEPGVMAMSYLGQTKAGEWKIISGAWNNPAKELDEAEFIALMGRLVNLAAQ